MSYKLALQPTGFQRFRWNDELRERHKFVKQPDKSVVVALKETGEEVGRYSSSKEASEAYWESVPESHSWIPLLREKLEIGPGVTVENFLNAIKQQEEIAEFVAITFGEDWDQVKTNGPVRLYRVLSLEDTLSDTYGFHMGLGNPTLHVEQQITLAGKTAQSFDYRMSLLEVMLSLFEKNTKQLHFVKDGGLRLCNSQGETVDPLESLLDYVEFHDSMTLNDLFQWVDNNPALTEFIGAFSWCGPIRQFHAEGNLPQQPETDGEQLHRLEIVRHIEVKKVRSEKPWVSDWVDFVCWGEPSKSTIEWSQPQYVVSYNTLKTQGNNRAFRQDEGATSEEATRQIFDDWCQRVGIQGVEITNVQFIEGNACPSEEAYGIGMTPVHQYSHLPLELVTSCKLQESNLTNQLDLTNLWQGNVRYTLLDILDTIYWEISYYGSPEDRDNTRQDLCEQVEKIANIPENPDERDSENFRALFGELPL